MQGGLMSPYLPRSSFDQVHYYIGQQLAPLPPGVSLVRRAAGFPVSEEHARFRCDGREERLHVGSSSFVAGIDIGCGLRLTSIRTFPTFHSPKRRVLIPRAVSSAAIARSEMCPAARTSASTGTRSAANASAFTDTVARSATPPFPARRRHSAPVGFPSFTPRALATASATFVRREIASRSAWATSAMVPTVWSLASGMSTATNRTPTVPRDEMDFGAALFVSRKWWRFEDGVISG